MIPTQKLLLDDWHLPPERIKVLHPGVDTKRFVPAARDALVRSQLGWENRPVILTVGRLQKRKGHDMMIRALAEIRKAIPDVLYAIAGDGEERQSLEQQVEEAGLTRQVQFLGETDDLQLVTCYQQADLFVLPNRQVGQDIEGFGMVLLEAQACGKPVVAGGSGGTSETMRHPVTGQLIPCDSPEQLAVTVAELLNQPELLATMGRAARDWVVSRFDWSALTVQSEQAFTDVPSEPSP
jgi:phosphatidylinositol alpha-1,6-mannosyltransferase